MRIRALALAVALSLSGLLAGCGGDDPKPVTGPGLPSQAQLTSYFKAITGADPDEMSAAAKDVAARGSLARAYAAYNADFATAAAAAGQAGEPVEVTEVDGGFKACVGDSAHCATWTDLTGKDGKLVDFEVSGTRLDDLLVDLSGQRPVRSAGLYKVQPGYAYRQAKSGLLYVVCTVTAGDVALSPKPGSYIEADLVVKGGDAPSPATIDAGTKSPIILAFPKAKDAALDGQVTFDLGLDGQGTESIGFGLADPAAS